MKGSFFRSMLWLHGWAGLLAGWLLYAIFLTGSATYYRSEISHWMRPELGFSIDAGDDARIADGALRRLRTIGADAERWRVTLPNAREPATEIHLWRKSGKGPSFVHEWLDPASGAPSPARATLGGDFLYYFHFDLQMPSIWGRLLVGLAAIVMLVTLVSGVVAHKRLFADFFTFRPDATRQRAWLDGHNISGVLALPFHLVITYTGLVALMFLYMPWGIHVAYEGRAQALLVEAGLVAPTPAVSDPAPLAPIASLLAEARRRWAGGRVGVIEIYRPGEVGTLIELTRDASETLAYRYDKLRFIGPEGRSIPQSPPSAVVAAQMTMYGLHIGRFADAALRACLFICGATATAMIGTGLVLWSVSARRRETSRMGLFLVERLNLGVIVGLPIAVAAYFWANRLIPSASPGRLLGEPIAFFSTWLAVLLVSLLPWRRTPWTPMLLVAAGAFAALPLADVEAYRSGEIASYDRAFLGFDAAMAAIGSVFAVIARKLREEHTRDKINDRTRERELVP
ncbi:iron uptake protein (plasmid) [Methylosinus sp. C49]|uniref:PepSY-associated TM helix domain-containing protein n=1 Tax=Methylosinus sp. C49 TaxID=2699395 RepID=UPI001367703D|nr:PepSY-associated TM helix domain-containing protein [Methylosinus sp. C49]BBU63747.1 iron uptake protein [Methylosinus sp. C49]